MPGSFEARVASHRQRAFPISHCGPPSPTHSRAPQPPNSGRRHRPVIVGRRDACAAPSIDLGCRWVSVPITSTGFRILTALEQAFVASAAMQCAVKTVVECEHTVDPGSGLRLPAGELCARESTNLQDKLQATCCSRLILCTGVTETSASAFVSESLAGAQVSSVVVVACSSRRR